MPILTLHSLRELADEEKQQLASKLTEITARELGKDPTVTVVRIVTAHEGGDWFVAGRSVRGEQPLCALSIQITRGTNTQAQKNAWLSAVWAVLGSESASLPSYLSVIELDAEQWGYNGLSQQRRKELHV